MRLVVAINDRCTINRDGRRPMVRSIDRCIMGSIGRALVASCDRAYDQSWHPKTDGTINHGCNDLSHDQLLHRATDRTTNRTINRTINHLAKRFGIARLELLNMTIELDTTAFAMAITHDQSYVLSTIVPRFQHFSVAGGS